MTVIYETLYLGGVSTLGLLVLAALTHQPARAISLALSFPVGFVATALIVGLCLLFSGSITVVSLGTLGCLLAVILTAVIARFQDFRARDILWPLFGLWILSAILVVGQDQASVVVLTYDSFNYAGLSGNIAMTTDGLDQSYLARMLLSYPALVPFGYAPAGLWGHDVILAGPPMFAISAAGLVAVAVFEAVHARSPTWARAASLIAFAFVLSAPQVRFHAFYVMPNLAMATLVAGSGYAIWRLAWASHDSGIDASLQNVSRGWVGVLAILLIGVGLARLEGALFVSVLGLAALLAQLHTPFRLSIAFACVSSLLLGWLLFLASNAGNGESIIGAETAIVQSLVLLVVLAGMMAANLSRLQNLINSGVLATPAVASVVLVTLWMLSPDNGRATFGNWFQNLTLPVGLWGGSFLALTAAAGTLTAFRAPLQAARPLIVAVLTLVLMTIALGIFREMPYRLGAQDSGNRIMLQIFPLAVMSVGIWAANAMDPRQGHAHSMTGSALTN